VEDVVEAFVRLDYDYTFIPTLWSYFLPPREVSKNARDNGYMVSLHSRVRCSGVCNTSATGVRHHLHVLVQSTLINLERVRFPLLAPLLQLFLGDTELDGVLHRVNVDNVSIPYEGDRPADLGLGCDVTDAEPVRPVRIHVIPEKGGWSGSASSLRTGFGKKLEASDEVIMTKGGPGTRVVSKSRKIGPPKTPRH
jgi:hypothetical protein